MICLCTTRPEGRLQPNVDAIVAGSIPVCFSGKSRDYSSSEVRAIAEMRRFDSCRGYRDISGHSVAQMVEHYAFNVGNGFINHHLKKGNLLNAHQGRYAKKLTKNNRGRIGLVFSETGQVQE